MYQRIILILFCLFLLNACAVGPNYKRPPVVAPIKFKEAPKGWKLAHPSDDFNRGKWWLIFHDSELNALEEKLNIDNQNIAMAAAQFRQAIAIVDQARAGFFPTLTLSPSVTRQRQVSSSSGAAISVPNDATGVTSFGRGSNVATFHTLLLNGTWEPDIWGSIRRTVEADMAGAQASAAQLALARLSAQASLAQFYFELRGVDRDLQLLNDTVANYRNALQLTRNRYASGVVGRVDVAQAQSQLEVAEAQALNLKITRAQYEHAIAVLIGKPASTFSLYSKRYSVTPPVVPLVIPSSLLERRPDVAQAERFMAQANAEIGVAIAAYLPNLGLSGSASSVHTGLEHWFSIPSTAWELTGQLSQILFDGGYRSATIKAASANYKATVASYRQVVLTAFQDVEDNLVAVRILKSQEEVLHKAANDARLAEKLITNQYKAGTVAYTDVITAQTNAFTAEKNAIDARYLRMTSTVGLIKAIGGGWNIKKIDNAGCPAGLCGHVKCSTIETG
jgi:NodT family efflux transporter outer membrane factor (OMF) lipoprotein